MDKLDWVGVGEAPLGLIEEVRSFDEIVCWYGANRPEFRELVAQMGLPFRFSRLFRRIGPAVTRWNYTWGRCGRSRRSRRRMGSRASVAKRPSRANGWQSFSRFPAAGEELAAGALSRAGARAGAAMRVEWRRGPEDPEFDGAVVIEDLYDWLATWRGPGSTWETIPGLRTWTAAVGTPVLALFGPTDPNVGDREGSMCGLEGGEGWQGVGRGESESTESEN